jgi:ketosteroid isomerase-like protein
VVATGAQFTMACINVMTVRDGLVVHSRDYSDPIAVSQVLGLLPQLADQLSRDAGN